LIENQAEDIKPLLDWLVRGISFSQPSSSRGTQIRWKQEAEDRELGREFTEQQKRVRFRELWLLELESDAADMDAAGDEGWGAQFMPPMGIKSAVLKGILSADGWTPLQGKRQTIQEVKEDLARLIG
jgi:hypothetical protein